MKINLNGLLELSDKQSNLVFLSIILAGGSIIVSAFYFIDINALLNQGFFTIKEKLLGIGVVVLVVHILLTCLVRSGFRKIQHAKQIIDQKNDELKKIDEAKTEFVAMVTHELKTPIVPIVSYASMLLQQRFGPVNDVQRQKLQIMISGAESLQCLIQDILDLHKADLGKLKLHLEFEDIKDVIQEALSITFPLANRRGIILDDQTSQNITISMDRRRMLQVITNLIKNAIDFVPLEEGIITIQQELQNETMILSITDNGPGIPKDKVNGLFKKFYQTETSATGGRDSTGLGLSICKMIVEQHGGKIWAESEIGKGTSIKISLPVQKTITSDKIATTVNSN
ncbi:MAG: HAMP domain-containing histidine kinase [Thaumarchaeota archaeon]|nr:HAMP domain-containing histidine kinase [Nitrososphaerota archaeon]